MLLTNVCSSAVSRDQREWVTNQRARHPYPTTSHCFSRRRRYLCVCLGLTAYSSVDNNEKLAIDSRRSPAGVCRYVNKQESQTSPPPSHSHTESTRLAHSALRRWREVMRMILMSSTLGDESGLQKRDPQKTRIHLFNISIISPERRWD